MSKSARHRLYESGCSACLGLSLFAMSFFTLSLRRGALLSKNEITVSCPSLPSLCKGEMSPLSKSHSSSAVHERDEREHVRERRAQTLASTGMIRRYIMICRFIQNRNHGENTDCLRTCAVRFALLQDFLSGCFLVSRHHCQWHIAKRTMFGNSSIMKAVRE